jgi:hypothetical protein
MTRLRSRLGLLLVSVVLAWIFLFYSHNLVNRLEETNRRANETIAWFWAGTQIPLSVIVENQRQAVCSGCGTSREYNGPAQRFTAPCLVCGARTTWFAVPRWSEAERELVLESTRALFRRLVSQVDYSTVLSDASGNPQIVNGEPVPDDASLEVIAACRRTMRKLDELNAPIPLLALQGDTIGWLHYGTGNLTQELALVPIIELGVLVILALVFFAMVRGEIRREKEMAWVGFAKETAHQLGTPLSSLLGWMELLRQRPESATDEEFAEALSCMSTDIDRLGQIAQRYGEMGKKPRLKPGDVNEIIESTVAYFCQRQGLLHSGVRIETSLEAASAVDLNPVLLGWVFENLLKNAVAALSEQDEGLVTVTSKDVVEAGGRVILVFTDNGRGIPFRDQGRIFQAGFTTRRGGWGLGLTLSRRIIEEYHGGSIRLASSSPGRGSTFVIELPAAPLE